MPVVPTFSIADLDVDRVLWEVCLASFDVVPHGVSVLASDEHLVDVLRWMFCFSNLHFCGSKNLNFVV